MAFAPRAQSPVSLLSSRRSVATVVRPPSASIRSDPFAASLRADTDVATPKPTSTGAAPLRPSPNHRRHRSPSHKKRGSGPPRSKSAPRQRQPRRSPGSPASHASHGGLSRGGRWYGTTLGAITPGDDVIGNHTVLSSPPPAGFAALVRAHSSGSPDGRHMSADAADLLRKTDARKPHFSFDLSRPPDDEVRTRFDELETLRSRKPIFRRMRATEAENRQLRALNAQQADRIRQLEWELASDKQSLVALQTECMAVRAATSSMAQLVRESEADVGDLREGPGGRESPPGADDTLWSVFDGADPTGAGGSLMATVGMLGTKSWAYKGVARMFRTFDVNTDGVLDLDEMNALQAALGNATGYTADQYFDTCRALDIEWKAGKTPPPSAGEPGGGGPGPVLSGVTLHGLFQLYQHMGVKTLSKDMEALHIPRETAEEQLSMMRRAVEHLKSLADRVKSASVRHKQLMLQCSEETERRKSAETRLEAAQTRLHDTQAVADTLRARTLRAEDEAARAKADETIRMSSARDLQRQLDAAHQGLRDMNTLLTAKVGEKQELQRALWHLERKYETFSSRLRESQMTVWQQSQRARESQKTARMLHMRLAGSTPTHADGTQTDDRRTTATGSGTATVASGRRVVM